MDKIQTNTHTINTHTYKPQSSHTYTNNRHKHKQQTHTQNHTYVVVHSCLQKTYTYSHNTPLTLDPKSFDYQFLDTLDEMGQCIPNDGDKRGEEKGLSM